jgi:hypothetical protein
MLTGIVLFCVFMTGIFLANMFLYVNRRSLLFRSLLLVADVYMTVEASGCCRVR